MLFDVISIGCGLTLILLVLVDVFQTLFNPRRVGSLSQHTLNWLWLRGFAKRRVRSGLMVLVGPLFILLVLLAWLGLTIIGWALIYRAYLPDDAFLFSQGLAPREQYGMLDALYFSAVVQTTLGLGDITPTSNFLRIVTPVQAAAGFALLTAGITWVLGIYPALVRRQQFSEMVHAVQRALGEHGLASPDLASGEIPSIARSLAEQLMMVRSDLLQFPITYYFHSNEPESSLPDVLLYLPPLIESAATVGAAESGGVSVQILEQAVEDFADSLRDNFPISSAPGNVLETYAHTAGYAHESRPDPNPKPTRERR